MENPVQDLEFLDLSNINESEKHQLQTVLYAPNPNARYPELPWCGGSMPVLHIVEPPPPPIDWMSHPQYAENPEDPALLNGSVEGGEEDEGEENCCVEAEDPQQGDSEGEAVDTPGSTAAHVYPGGPVPPPSSVSQAPPPVYPPPFSHVYVNNMTANVSVHGYSVHGPPHHGPPPAAAFHQMPASMYPGPPPGQQSGGEPVPPPPSGGGGQKKRYKGNSNSSNGSTGGSANRRIEHSGPPHQAPVDVGPHPHHHGAPVSYGYAGAPPPGAGGYYPMYFHPGGPQHAQGGSPLYFSPHPQHPMYHPHHHGGPPPPHQMYPPLYQNPHHAGIPPVTHVEESMQQQSYMVSQHQLDQQHHHHQQQHKSSPHHLPQHPPAHMVVPQPPPQHAPPPQAVVEMAPPPGTASSGPEEVNGETEEEWQERNGGEPAAAALPEGGEVEYEEEEEEQEGEETEAYEGDEEVVQNTETTHYPSDTYPSGDAAVITPNLSAAPEQITHSSPSSGGGDPAVTPSSSSVTTTEPPGDSEVAPSADRTLAEPTHEVVVLPVAPAPAAMVTPEPAKTWASLLKKSTSATVGGDQKLSSSSPGAVSSLSKPCARVEPMNTYQSAASSATSSVATNVPSTPYTGSRYYSNSNANNNGQYPRNNRQYYNNDDGSSQNLGKLLLNTRLDHKGISLMPRGLINKSNYCYINATLQALIACPPFYNLLRAINKQRNGGYYQNRNNHYNNNNNAATSEASSNTPIFNAMLQLAGEFQYLQLTPGTNSGAGLRSRELGGAGGRRGGGGNDDADLKLGTPFTPTYVYQILASIKSDSAFNVEGRQEDAEEFLTFLLNGLNDEMLELIKGQTKEAEASDSGAGKPGTTKTSGARATGLSNGELNGDPAGGDGDDGDWKEVTKESKNKGCVVRRHTSVSDKTPVSEIFRGQVRTRVHRVSDSTVTENIQPFFTLPLDIEKVSSVKEALDLLVLKEGLEGVTSTKTNQETEAYQTVTLEELPFVLLLHLKCFDYKSHTCHKIQKSLEFPVLLSLEPKLLSNGKMKKVGGGPLNGQKNKQYKLFAVVYHDGKEASKGHYITDVFHVGYSGWIRYDDANVRFVSETEVLHSRPPRVPYILYYRRADTIISKNLSPTS